MAEKRRKRQDEDGADEQTRAALAFKKKLKPDDAILASIKDLSDTAKSETADTRTLSDLNLPHAFREVVDLEGEKIQQEIFSTVMDVARSILAGNGFGYNVPARGNANQLYVPELDRIVLKDKCSFRQFANVSSVRKTAITTRILQLVHQLCMKRIHVTKRDLFYTDVKLFQDQGQSDTVLDDVSCMLGCTRMLSCSTEVASTQQSVDVIASQMFTEVSSKKKKIRTHFNWSEQQDDILIPALLDEVVQGGRRSDNGLKAAGYNRVLGKIAPLITDAIITVKEVRNRARTLKANFVMAKEAIAQSGFNLSEDGRVMADEEVWVRYIEAHPKASILRGMRVRHFDKLQIIFGNDQATREFAIEGNDSVPQTSLDYIDIDLEEGQTVGDGEGECSHGNAPTAKRPYEELIFATEKKEINRCLRTVWNGLD